MAGHFYNCHLGRCQRLLKYIPNTLKWITYLFQILTIWAKSLHFSFDIGCTFCSLKASTKMHLFWIGTNTAAFRTLSLSSQVLDKARVHRHPALDSRLTWPKWSEPNMRSPPPSVSPGINLSAGQGLNIQITASPTSLICVTDQNTIFRPTSPSSTLFVEFILNSFSTYEHKCNAVFPWVTLGLKCWFANPACTLFCGLRPGAEVGGRQSGL